MRKKNRESYVRNQEARIAYAHAYYAANKDKAKVWSQNARRTSGYNGLLAFARQRAKAKGLPCDLTPEWAKARWSGRCELTDLPFFLEYTGIGGPKQMSPTIDRIRPELGYVKDNCRFVLQAVNALKNNGTDKDMLRIAEALVRKLKTDSRSPQQ